MKRPLFSLKPSFSAPRNENKLSSTRISEKTFNKKRFWLIVAILALVEAAIFCVALQWKYIFPSREVSDLYTRYENVDGVDISYIKGYKVNGSIFVDVTMLEATTDSAWIILQHDFSIPIIPKEYEEYFYADTYQLSLKLVPKKDSSLPMDSTILNNDLVAISYPKRLICIFSIEDTSQLKAILRDNYDNNVTLKQ